MQCRPDSTDSGVGTHLAKHRLGVLLAVQLEKNLLHQRLLFTGKNLADALFGDMPVVIYLFAQWMLELKRHDFLLRFVETAEQLGHQRLGAGLLFRRLAKRRRGQGGGAKCSALHKTPPIHRRQAIRAFVEDLNFHVFFK